MTASDYGVEQEKSEKWFENHSAWWQYNFEHFGSLTKLLTVVLTVFK